MYVVSVMYDLGNDSRMQEFRRRTDEKSDAWRYIQRVIQRATKMDYIRLSIEIEEYSSWAECEEYAATGADPDSLVIWRRDMIVAQPH